MNDYTMTRAAAISALDELQGEHRVRAMVSGGAALLPPEQGTAVFQPEQLQRAAEALGLPAPPPEPAGGAEPQSLNWSTGPITFSGGVPVGGWANLTLFSGGFVKFSGHFHVSGAPSYNIEFVWGVKSGSGAIYLFRAEGRVHGTFESGSRNFDWDQSKTDPTLARDWPNLWAHWEHRWNAHTNVNLAAVVSTVQNALVVAGTVIAIF